MKFLNIFVLFFFVSGMAASKNVDVRLFSTARLTQCKVSTHKAPFYLIALNSKGEILDTVSDFNDSSQSKLLQISLAGKKINAVQGKENYGNFKKLMLAHSSAEGHFIIDGKGRERIYSGTLLFSVRNSKLLIVNRVELEEYVAGVVESEGGHNAEIEYFKAQAILARTWVLKNWNKHKKEGYNVRDDVSSQAYYSKAYLQNGEKIYKAVLDTKDTILIDEKGKPIFGAFHSNSGGETVNSEDVWNGKVDYLRAVPDTFSLNMKRSSWEKQVDKKQFLAYFALKLGQNANDSAFINAVLSFRQPQRQAYFTHKGKSLKLRWVREKFHLRSTYFEVYDNGETVLLKGRGFGHGVGLSQEGAMHMAKLGYNHKQILDHYFQNVKYGVVVKN